MVAGGAARSVNEGWAAFYRKDFSINVIFEKKRKKKYMYIPWLT